MVKRPLNSGINIVQHFCDIDLWKLTIVWCNYQDALGHENPTQQGTECFVTNDPGTTTGKEQDWKQFVGVVGVGTVVVGEIDVQCLPQFLVFGVCQTTNNVLGTSVPPSNTQKSW
jgi:hypothetical protein